MGQSFLTHDEKSSGSPSPDLLQFNGAPNHHHHQPKFFGSLSSVKETSTSSGASSRSPLEVEESDSDRSLRAASTSSSSGLSPSPTPPADASSSIDGNSADCYSSLIPTPILPGNVDRLREKFMDYEKTRIRIKNISAAEQNALLGDGNKFSKLPALDVNRQFVRSPTGSVVFDRGDGNFNTFRRSGRYSTPNQSAFRNSNFPPATNRSRTLPPTPLSGSARTSMAYERNNLARSDYDLSECFRQMALASCNKPQSPMMVTYRPPRIRPFVQQPRSVIIKEGYLPVIQKVGLAPVRQSCNQSGTSKSRVSSSSRREGDAPDSLNVTSECFTSINFQRKRDKTDDRLLESAIDSSSLPPNHSRMQNIKVEERVAPRVVTNNGDHTVRKVTTKDAEVNTSAEVLVLPKGIKSDGKSKKKVLGKRRKKRGVRRVTRVFSRIMIRFLEFF